jgi:hypothetical protein
LKQKAFKSINALISAKGLRKMAETEKEDKAKLCGARNAATHSENTASRLEF